MIRLAGLRVQMLRCWPAALSCPQRSAQTPPARSHVVCCQARMGSGHKPLLKIFFLTSPGVAAAAAAGCSAFRDEDSRRGRLEGCCTTLAVLRALGLSATAAAAAAAAAAAVLPPPARAPVRAPGVGAGQGAGGASRGVADSVT